MGRPVILVAEDHAPIRTQIADDLRHTGYHVAEAASADEALGMLLTRCHIDLIVTDLRMPGIIDGIELVLHAPGVIAIKRVTIMSARLGQSLPSSNSQPIQQNHTRPSHFCVWLTGW